MFFLLNRKDEKYEIREDNVSWIRDWFNSR